MRFGILWLALLAAAGWGCVMAAQADVLWQIDRGGRAGEDAGPGFREGALFVVGKSDPARDWPFQQPGPADVWAGGGEHEVVALFGVKTTAPGTCRLVLSFLETHKELPPWLAVTVNEQRFPARQVAAGTGNYQDPAQGKRSQLTFEFPASLLRPGNNAIRIANTRGSWLYYDRVALETPAGVVGAPADPNGPVPSPPVLPAVVEVDTGRTVVEPFMGLGVQWDPFDKYQPSPEMWKKITERMAFCRPGFLRVMSGAGSYCLGFADDGRPRYVWQEGDAQRRAGFERICAILDWAQRHDVDVLLGEWGPPRGLIPDQTDPRWARIIADELAYLRNERGYTCVRFYNLINEPNGDWSGNKDYATWVVSMRNLRKALDARGLSASVRLIGPDTTGNTGWMEPFEWLDRAAKDLPEVIGAWDLHWYALDPEVLGGAIERVLTEKREMLGRAGPEVAGKPLFLGEAGILTGRCNGDQQPRVKTFEYGVLMADYVAQVARAGWMGAVAWDLDDAMHAVKGSHTPDPPDDLTLKVWGFWNSQGARMGHPEEEAPRPWFYTWSLMSRLFPKGSRIVSASYAPVPRFRAVAGTRRISGREHLTVMLVNDDPAARKVSLRVPAAPAGAALTRYVYFENDRPTDAEGYPKAKDVLQNVDLRRGLDLEMPGRSVIFLTTVPPGEE